MGTSGIINPMRKGNLLKKLTLVYVIFGSVLCVCGAVAKPHLDTPIGSSANDDVNNPSRPELIENSSITPVKSGHPGALEGFNKKNYYHAYRQSLSLFFGATFGEEPADVDEEKESMEYIAGFAWLLPSQYSPHWDAEASLSTSENAHVSVMRRYTRNEKGAFRPFYRYGLMHKVVAEERFASFSNWDNYLARVGLGLEDTSEPPRSLRIVVDVAVGKEDAIVMLTCGYTWGF